MIEPFIKENLSTSSYDVTLGQYYFRESMPEAGLTVYNPYSSDHVKRVWGKVQEAESAAAFSKRTGIKLENISDDDRIIWLAPGETILGHTMEFVGGRHTVTTMMKARSSMGRNFIEVCKCAGWGDIGYINRVSTGGRILLSRLLRVCPAASDIVLLCWVGQWTMEITNNSRYYSIPLVVGRRIAQIVFFDSDGTVENRSYVSAGKYQTTDDITKIMAEWSPQSCLPRMFADREIKSGPVPDPLLKLPGGAAAAATASGGGGSGGATAAVATK